MPLFKYKIKPIMPLTDIICKNAKPKEKTYKLTDQGGLYLEISPSGSKYFRQKYYFAGKEKRIALGVYPNVKLKDARLKQDEIKKLLSDGIDPAEKRKRDKIAVIINKENSFEAISGEWLSKHRELWSDKHYKTIVNMINSNLLPYIGNKPIKNITFEELGYCFKQIEDRGAFDIANRVLQITKKIYEYAVKLRLTERNIANDFTGTLAKREIKHRAYLEEKDLPDFFKELENYDGELQTKLAIKLLILTWVRTNELRGAKWEEFELEDRQWRVPRERMKGKGAYITPLSKEALIIIEKLKELNGHKEYLFPNRNRPKEYISENTMLYALYRMGYKGKATIHGFRATASTICNEKSNFNIDAIERQLDHRPRNKVRASYNHAQYLEERKAMMQWWSNYLIEKGMGV